MDIQKNNWLANLIGDIWLSEEPGRNLAYLTDHLENRFAGTEGEHNAAKYIQGKFREYGLQEAALEEFNIQGWVRGKTNLKITSPVEKNLEAIALPYSPHCDLEAEVLDLGCGLEEDFKREVKDKIVLVSAETPPGVRRWVHRKEKYNRAVEGGAAAFIYMNHIYGNLPQTGSLNDNKMGEIPGISVSKEVGERIKRLVNSGEKVMAHLVVECEAPESVSHNVTGLLKGSLGNKEIAICAHYDGHDISQAALDNAAGTVILLELARVLSIYKEQFGRTIRFISFGSEELGLTGSKVYTESHDLTDLGVVLNLDCAGNGREVSINVNGFDELAEQVREFSNGIDFPVTVSNHVFPHSDHWNFVEKGIPGCMISSRGDTKGRGWGHTSADTLDKVELRNIKDNTIVLVKLIHYLVKCVEAIPRRTPGDIKQLLDEIENEG